MMNKKLRLSNVLVYALVALIFSLYIVFFTGRITDQETGRTTRSWFTTNGVNQFRLGMDVSGGVRLTYKVDFAKYDQLYSTVEEKDYMKNNAINIIKKQIDKRVSVLGVSDYQAYTKKLEDQYYVVVEIGGIHSLEEAKEIIGKTVELEFKVAYNKEKDETPEILAQRKSLVQAILTDVNNAPENFATIGQGKESDDIYYQKFVQQPIQNLPTFFSINEVRIASMQSGAISSIMEGVYSTTSTQDENGQPVEDTVKGSTIVKFGGVEVKNSEEITLEKVQAVAQANNVDYLIKEDFDSYGLTGGEYKYQANTKQVVHNLGQILEGEVAYQADVYAISRLDRIGKTTEEIAAMTQDEDNITKDIVATLEKGEKVEREDTVKLTEGDNTWVAQETILGVIPSFTWTGESGIETFDTLDKRFIVSVKGVKKPEDVMYGITTLNNVSSSLFTKIDTELKTEKLITAEVIFIKDSPSWVTAKDSTTNQILNGAYFQRARLDTTQGAATVAIDFDDIGKNIFCNITKEYTQQQMAIFVGGQLQTAPVIQEEICGGTAVINGQSSVTEARTLIDSLNEGALPAPLLLANEEKVSPSLGQNALFASLAAGGLGMIAISLMLLFMYGYKKAFVGTLVLVMFLVYLLAVFKIVDYAFSLSGIAAIILSLGMGIDANILIFERVREELKAGKRMGKAIDDAYTRSRSAIRDGNLSTVMIGIFLLLWGVGIFKGFGSVVIVTTVMVMLVNVPLTKHLLHFFFSTKNDYMNDK